MRLCVDVSVCLAVECVGGRDVLALVTNEVSFCPMVPWPSSVPRETCGLATQMLFFFFFFVNPGFLHSKTCKPHLRESVKDVLVHYLKGIFGMEIVLCHCG